MQKIVYRKNVNSMGNFNLNEIINDIESLGREKDFTEYIEFFLIKIKKKDNDIYKQDGGSKTKEILFSSLVDELNSTRFKNREVVGYDAIISKRNTHELVNVEDFPNIAETLKKFNDENQHLTNTKGLDESKFHLYMVSLRGNRHTYKIFGSFSNILELRKKYLFGIVSGNFSDSRIEFKDKNNIVGFNKKIEILIVDDKQLLINQATSKFESLFKMNQLFSKQAIDILENNEKIKRIFDKKTRKRLSDKVRNGKRMASRLIKIASDEDRFNKTIDNISKIEQIINDKEHKFHNKVKDVIFKEGKLFVDEGKEIQLLDAISDAFYQAVISETENVDESRM